jgi:hypothetical protein
MMMQKIFKFIKMQIPPYLFSLEKSQHRNPHITTTPRRRRRRRRRRRF